MRGHCIQRSDVRRQVQYRAIVLQQVVAGREEAREWDETATKFAPKLSHSSPISLPGAIRRSVSRREYRTTSLSTSRLFQLRNRAARTIVGVQRHTHREYDVVISRGFAYSVKCCRSSGAENGLSLSVRPSQNQMTTYFFNLFFSRQNSPVWRNQFETEAVPWRSCSS